MAEEVMPVRLRAGQVRLRRKMGSARMLPVECPLREHEVGAAHPHPPALRPCVSNAPRAAIAVILAHST